MNIQELKQNSIKIDGRMAIKWPAYFNAPDEILCTESIRPNFNGRYFATNNSTVVYSSDSEDPLVAFVTPWTYEVMECLKEAGYTASEAYVPLSNGDVPAEENLRAKWQMLREAANLWWYKQDEHDCLVWCERQGITPLSDEFLAKFFRMPEEGVEVICVRDHCNKTYFPLAWGGVHGGTIDKIGRWAANNGKIVFIGTDGHTYVGKGVWNAVKVLMDHGFKEGGLFVPFSNGEHIVDPVLAAKWENLPKVIAADT